MSKLKSILELEALEAKIFLLKEESYCNFSLPSYFNFNKLLKDVDAYFEAEQLRSKCKPSKSTSVNYRILNNKDGKFAWIPYELIHPVLYLQLVNLITKEKYWELIRNEFSDYYHSENIQCLSIPHIRISDDGNGEQKYAHRWKEYEKKIN